MTTGWTIVVHGGSGTFIPGRLTAADEAAATAGLEAALTAGGAALAGAGNVLDAVEAAVRVLEDDPHFNAGRGSVFTWDGINEMDAAIMEGTGRAAGAVTGVTATRNPVSLARAAMAAGRHVLLSGAGAEQFAREAGLEKAGADYFALAERRRQLDEIKAGGGFDAGMKYGTVGAVAIDAAGHVAAATSTGGLTAKRWGRIGDTPLIGAGTYADDRACAVSCTGTGEAFIRASAGHEIAARIRLGHEHPEAAAAAVLADVGTLGGVGGVIVASPAWCGWAFTTAGMYRGRLVAGGVPETAIYG